MTSKENQHARRVADQNDSFKPNRGQREKDCSDTDGEDDAQTKHVPIDDDGFSVAIANIQQEIAALTQGLHEKMDDMDRKNESGRKSQSNTPRPTRDARLSREGSHDTPPAVQ